IPLRRDQLEDSPTPFANVTVPADGIRHCDDSDETQLLQHLSRVPRLRPKADRRSEHLDARAANRELMAQLNRAHE
ncbi:hypothetical protein, partial [Streptomyces mirabilis]